MGKTGLGLHAMRRIVGKILSLGAIMLPLAGPAQGEPLTKIRYEETVRSLQFTPTYVAMARNYFKEAGLNVTMRTAQGTDKAMAALLSGSADIALMGPEAVIYVANSESPLKPKIFSGLVATDGFLLVSRKPQGERKFDWNELKGKTIMAYRPGSTPDVYLETLLRRHKLGIGSDVKIVNNIGPSARMGAWMSGRADYAIFMEPEAGTIERNGDGQVVASIGHEIGPVDYTVFVADPGFIEKHSKAIQAWTDVIARALKDIAKDEPAVIAKDIASFFPGLSETELTQSIERYRKYHIWKTTPLVGEEAVSTLQDMLIASGTLKPEERVSYDEVVIPSFAKHAEGQ